jgi:hypothetical protein
MPPESLFVPRFAAEPPQDTVPTGRWAHKLREEFFAACLAIEAEASYIGEPGDVTFYPDRTYLGRTYVPATAPTSTDLQLYGYISFVATPDGEPEDFYCAADVTAETAAANPDWAIDLCEDVIGGWRGEHDNVAAMTLVWGTPMIDGATIATAELGAVVVDQCHLAEGRFTLIAPDDYRGELLGIKLFDDDGRELASESLYDEDEDSDDEGEDGEE